MYNDQSFFISKRSYLYSLILIQKLSSDNFFKNILKQDNPAMKFKKISITNSNFTNFLIIILIITGPFLYISYSRISLLNDIKSSSMNLNQIDNKLAFINLMNYTEKNAEIKEISNLLHNILNTPIVERIYILNIHDDINTLKSLLNYEYENTNNVFEVYFNIKNALSFYKTMLSKNQGYYSVIYILMISSAVLLLGMYLIKFKFLTDDTNKVENSKVISLDFMEKKLNLLAFDLHDDMTQKLAIISRNLEENSSINDKNNCLYSQYAKELLDTVRGYSNTLMTPEELFSDFDEAIGKLCSDFSIYSHLKLNVRKMGLKALIMNKENSIHLYRVIQEFLNNAHKHSFATQIDISIIYSHPLLRLNIKDNGQGFNMENLNGNGIGMNSIKYRLELLDAKYTFNSTIKKGTELEVEIQVAYEKCINS